MFIFALGNVEYCSIGNTYAFYREEDWNNILELLDKSNIKYKKAENSYAGIYMIEILEK